MFDWIVALLQQAGYFGIAFLMFAENVFPPIPSELIMPLAGFLVHRGDLGFVPTMLAGMAGSIAGAWIWYFAAMKFKRRRVRRLISNHGRWFTMTLEDLDRAEDWFERHGRMAVLVGRLLPGVRTLISVPAGLTGMPQGTFLLLTAVGTTVWVGILTLAGMLLGSQYDLVQQWLNPVSNILFGALALIYVYRLVTHKGVVEDEGQGASSK
ncbi:DedA family protein [Sulfitobacter sp. D35]|uniref:DedA family protein n=1 Tax=Sulfitobacter sp. D35 TaxID=3083252 RepID=UPI00296E7938|nr:DedA family protein [Sulfitobacter sp. D35]MDW4497225.1 DedA family protein [Sulfitobacter sp. D35]